MGRLIIILAVIVVLVLVWLSIRPQRKNPPTDAPNAGGSQRPLGPDDDPDFLRKL